MAWLIIGLIMGAACSAIAASKGRNAVGWFFIGFLFGLVALIIVLVVSNLKEEQRYREHAASERRRLREQLQQERMKTESFRRHAGARLDAHDRTLGVDTRTVAPLGGGEVEAALPAGTLPPPVPGGEPWHYEMGGQPQGPVDRGSLVQMLRSGALPRTSLVWREGMAGWTRASDLPELST